MVDIAALPHPYRRLGDPVSMVNHDMHDSTSLLQSAIRLLDHHGLKILEARAVYLPRNNIVQIAYQDDLDQLFPEAVEQRRCKECSVWVTTVFGVEVRWTRSRSTT